MDRRTDGRSAPRSAAGARTHAAERRTAPRGAQSLAPARRPAANDGAARPDVNSVDLISFPAAVSALVLLARPPALTGWGVGLTTTPADADGTDIPCRPRTECRRLTPVTINNPRTKCGWMSWYCNKIQTSNALGCARRHGESLAL